MRINYDYEPEIVLKDLFFDILYHWRSILAAALIGALLFGGYSFIAGRGARNAPVETVQQSEQAEQEAAQKDDQSTQQAQEAVEKDDYDIQLEAYKAQLVRYNSDVAMYQSRINNAQAQIEDLKDYMAHSVYFNLDANTLHSGFRTYLIQAKLDDIDPNLVTLVQEQVNVLLVLYYNALRDSLDSDEFKELLGVSEEEYIEELVEIKTNSSSNTLELTVRGNSDESVAKALDFFDKRLKEACNDKMQDICHHELAVIGDRKNQHDQVTLLVDSQQKQAQNLVKYQNAIVDAEKAMDKLVVPVEPEFMSASMTEQLAEMLSEPNPELELQIKSQAKKDNNNVVKLAALGLVLFILLAVVYHGVRYLAGERLRDSIEMTRRYGLLVYADASHSRARRPGKGIDGLIERWEFGKNKTEVADAGRQAAGLLGKRMPQGTNLVLVSTRPAQQVGQLHDALSKEMADHGINVACAAECLREDAMNRIPDGATLVIVEEKHASRVAAVNREAELMSMLGVKAIGAILL